MTYEFADTLVLFFMIFNIRICFEFISDLLNLIEFSYQNVCNQRSARCVAHNSEYGPTTVEDAVCLDCSHNSEGRYCERCSDGYFMVSFIYFL